MKKPIGDLIRQKQHEAKEKNLPTSFKAIVRQAKQEANDATS